MEARRLERKRRESAKSNAAPSLPSTQDQDFHLRLIDLYQEYPCLWNTSLNEYEDAELKRQAWEEISNKLGSHLTPCFVRNRISSMKYRLNVYKLQHIEHKMNPACTKQPEKLYFIDRFSFLDTVNNSKQLSDSDQLECNKDNLDPKSSVSIASIFKQRIQQQQMRQLPQVLQRLNQPEQDNYKDLGIANIMQKHMQQATQKSSLMRFPKFRDTLLSARSLLQQTRQQRQPGGDQVIEKKENNPENVGSVKQRMQRCNLAEQGAASQFSSTDSFSDVRTQRLGIPSVVMKRMRKQLALGMHRGFEMQKGSPDSLTSISQNYESLQAQPGDSVSKTKMKKSIQDNQMQQSSEESHQHSDDEDLYRLHWTIRAQQRSLRGPGTLSNLDHHPQPLPPLLLGPHSTPNSNMENPHDTHTKHK